MRATHAYVGYRPCGHPVSLIVDDPGLEKSTASHVAKEIRDGHRVERVTIEEARVIGVTYCACTPSKDYAKTITKRMRRR